MKIESATPTAVGPSTGVDVERAGPVSGRAAPAARGAGAGAPTSGADTVVISALSTKLQAISSGAANEVVDTARVEEIKLAISEGRLSVNAEAVASKLLQSVSEMLGTQRRV